MIRTLFSIRGSLRRRFAGAMAGGVLALAGCSVLPEPSEDPTRYYLLGGAATARGLAEAPKGTRRVGVRSVELAPYLRNTRSIVVRNGSNEIRYQDFARWAEPLDAAIQSAVRDRLITAGSVSTAEVPPFAPEVTRDFDITIRVLRCEGALATEGGKTTQFVALYEIADLQNQGRVLVRKEFVAPAAKWDGANFAQLAEHLGDAAAALGNDIASNLPK